MELILQVQTPDAVDAALAQGISGVAAKMPRTPDDHLWPQLQDWRAAAGRQGCKFFLVWDGLIPEAHRSQAAEMLAAAARLQPDALELRDLGLVREARRDYPQLPLHAPAAWGAGNSPAIRLAATLGFTRVAVSGPVNLKDLALLRRHTAIPLTVNLMSGCRGYPSLCLLPEYLDLSCEACCRFQEVMPAPGIVAMALEGFSGLCQLGVEAVQIPGDLFSPASLPQVIRLFQSVLEAAPMDRPGVLAAAREILTAFGEEWLRPAPTAPPPALEALPPPFQPAPAPPSRREFPGRVRIWLEARDYQEALALAREWRDPLVLALTPANLAGFLQDHRRWVPRRFIWRLPPAIRESALAFYPKALETLKQGGYSRFLAGDWGAVALAQDIAAEVYGDQTLGVRNAGALKTAQACGVTRVCLPPGERPEHWEEFLRAAPAGSFWGYLYRRAPLAVRPGEAGAQPPPADLRWLSAGEQAILVRRIPQNFRELGHWFKQQGVFPLVVALPLSPLPWGKLPSWLAPRASQPPRR